VRVVGRFDGDTFELTVANRGNPIPPETLAKLFQPFFRGGARRYQQGLGLGLYISAEVARAHGGTLQAASSAEETRFMLRIPGTSRV
jgi:sigma-B regulation protein RsbU (phosphoserine phosphatase)